MQALSLHATSVQPTQRRFAAMAIAGAVNITVIYAILAGLGYMPVPGHESEPTIRVIDQTLPKSTDALPPIRTPMITPGNPDIPKPVIDIGQDPDGGTFNPPRGGTGTPTGISAPATGLADTHTIPAYPALDRRLDHEGIVHLKLTIDAEGAVSDAVVAKSSGYDGLDAAAVAWVKAHWRYKPAMQNGTPVPATTGADVVFRLTQG